MVERIARATRRVIELGDALVAARFDGDTAALTLLIRERSASTAVLLHEITAARFDGVTDDLIRAALTS